MGEKYKIYKKFYTTILTILFVFTLLTDCSQNTGFGSKRNSAIELKMVSSNRKTSLDDNTSYSIDIKSLHMITDTDGYNYLILNHSIRNETNSKLDIGLFVGTYVPTNSLIQNGTELDTYYGLSDETKDKYSDLLQDSANSLTNHLRPNEVIDISYVCERYDMNSNITLKAKPLTYVAATEDSRSIIREFSF